MLKTFRRYAMGTLLPETVVAHDIEDFVTRPIPVHDYRELLFTFDLVSNDLEEGSSPGIKFTVEIDPVGNQDDDDFVALSDLLATANGFSAAGPEDATITSEGSAYRYYHEGFGVYARLAIEVTGTPTGGTATVAAHLSAKK